MPFKSFILFCVLASLWVQAFTQTLPAGPKVPSIGGGLPTGIPTNGLEALATKPPSGCRKCLIGTRCSFSALQTGLSLKSFTKAFLTLDPTFLSKQIPYSSRE